MHRRLLPPERVLALRAVREQSRGGQVHNRHHHWHGARARRLCRDQPPCPFRAAAPVHQPRADPHRDAHVRRAVPGGARGGGEGDRGTEPRRGGRIDAMRGPRLGVLLDVRNDGCSVSSGVTLDDGVYYNKYMYGNNIKMAQPLSDGLIEYTDGTIASEEQMAKDVSTFLMWAAEPHLEARHKMGFKAILYLIILTILVYFSMKKIWSRIESEV